MNSVVGMPWKCSGDGLGGVPGHPGRPGLILYVWPHRMDRMSAGQTGHFHGTNWTRPQDGCGPEGEVSHQISICLLVFLFPMFKFILHSCRSASVIFLTFRREMSREFVWTHKTEAENYRGSFRSIFRKKFVVQFFRGKICSADLPP